MDNDGNKYDDLSQGMVEEYVDGIKDDLDEIKSLLKSMHHQLM